MVTNGTKFSDYRTSRGFIGCTGRQRVTDDTVRSVVPREHRESWTIAILSRCLLLLFFLFFFCFRFCLPLRFYENRKMAFCFEENILENWNIHVIILQIEYNNAKYSKRDATRRQILANIDTREQF